MQIRTRRPAAPQDKSNLISMSAKKRTTLVRAVAQSKHGIMYPDFIWTRLWVEQTGKGNRRNWKKFLKNGNSVALSLFWTMTLSTLVQLIVLKSREKSLRR